jgi:hypothetical protein
MEKPGDAADASKEGDKKDKKESVEKIWKQLSNAKQMLLIRMYTLRFTVDFMC